MRGFKVLVLCLVFLLVASLAVAGEVDVLTKKLVEKGILTAEEAKAVLADTKESVKKQLADGKLDSVPAWAQNTKWGGDFRLRLESRELVQAVGGGKHDTRNRANMRLRYGFEAKVNDEINAGARLATGTGNQSARTVYFQDAFSERAVYVDLMYLDYSPKPVKGLKLIGGKFANPFYATSSLIWGAEINPEGVVAKYTKSVKPAGYPANIDLFANAGILPLDTLAGGNISPVLYAMQAGASTNVFDRKLKAAVAYYWFNDLKGAIYGDISPNSTIMTNSLSTTTSTTAKFLYNYRVLSLDAEYPILNIKYGKQTLPLGIYAGLLKNVAGEVKKDGAWLVGFSLGKAVDPKTWSFSYDYRRVARDATVDFLNDLTFHGGGTNAKGHKFSLSYIPLKNTTLALSYFATEKVQGLKAAGETRNTLDLDCVVKF